MMAGFNLTTDAHLPGTQPHLLTEPTVSWKRGMNRRANLSHKKDRVVKSSSEPSSGASSDKT